MNFVNRKPEIKFLDENSEKISGKNLIVFHSHIGIGKSEITKQFLQSYKKYPAIKVPISQKKSFPSGDYLSKIKDASNKPINQIYFKGSEDEFLFEKQHFVLPIKILFCLIEIIPVIKDIFKVFNNSYKEYCHAKQLLQTSYSKNNIIQIESYLEYLYCSSPFILNIENIQTIDEISWDSLYTLLSKAPDYIVILEYTENTEHDYEISDIIDKYETIISEEHIKIINIKRLSDDHVLQLDKSLSSAIENGLRKKLREWDGNLKEIKNYIYLNKYAPEKDSIYLTENLIKSLGEDSLQWLFHIYLAVDDFTKYEFNLLGLNESIFKELYIKQLIKIENGHIKIDHDTICENLDALDGSEFICQKETSIRFWQIFYKQKYKESKSTKFLYKILYFSLLCEDIEAVNSLLSKLHSNIISSANPNEYLKKIEKLYYKNFISNTNSKAIDVLIFWLVELYQNIGNYKKAYSFLKLVHDTKSKKYIILKALLLYQAGFQENAVNYCTKNIEFTSMDDHMELVLRIIRLESYYTLDNFSETKKEYKYIYRHSYKYESYLEFGFFLRNSELVKSAEDAIPDFKKSIIHFKRFNAKKQAVSSMLNLGVSYALTGDLESAKEQFDEAYANREEFIGLYDMILHNQSVVMQYQGDLKDVKDKILLAEKYAYYDFNQLAICLNLLVYNIRMQIEDELLIEKILQLIEYRTFKNKRIVCYAYINLYKYYKDKNDSLASAYYDKIFEYEPLPYYIHEWIGIQQLTPDDPEYHRTRIEWPINFLNEWSIEFDSSLMHF